jgi:hypothetical protein
MAWCAIQKQPAGAQQAVRSILPRQNARNPMRRQKLKAMQGAHRFKAADGQPLESLPLR